MFIIIIIFTNQNTNLSDVYINTDPRFQNEIQNNIQVKNLYYNNYFQNKDRLKMAGTNIVK